MGKAFQDLNAASAPLFDDLALAERVNGMNAADVRAKGRTTGASPAPNDPCASVTQLVVGEEQVQDGFCIGDSAYYSVIVDPPATATFRRSLAALESYTNVLLILAEGRNIEAAQAEVQSLAANIGGIVDLAGATGAKAALTAFSGALQPLLEIAARRANAKELARNVIDVGPQATAVVKALRESAPEVFDLVTEESVKQMNAAALDITSGDAAKKALAATAAKSQAARIDAYRVAVSNYVVLLEQYQKLLDQLVASYDAEGKPITLSSLVEKSAELSGQADAWRRTYSALRMGF